MLDELLDLDRDKGGRGTASPEKRRGIRGLLDRLIGGFADHGDGHDSRRHDGEDRRDSRGRRRDNDGLDFGD
jgi:hypothetical protein